MKKNETKQSKSKGTSKFYTLFIIGMLIFASLMFTGILNTGTPFSDDGDTGTRTWESHQTEDTSDILLISSETCSCCHQYTDYLRTNSYSVDHQYSSNINGLKYDLNIPEEAWSCHTVKIGNYFVEGHVPMDAVEKLLDEQPFIQGIALPDMPSGSPGMGGAKSGSFDILSINNGEVVGTFVTI